MYICRTPFFVIIHTGYKTLNVVQFFGPILCISVAMGPFCRAISVAMTTSCQHHYRSF